MQKYRKKQSVFVKHERSITISIPGISNNSAAL